MRTPNLLATDTFPEQLRSALAGNGNLRMQLMTAKELCFATNINGDLPVREFLEFTARCFIAGEFLLAKDAYRFAMKQDMPTAVFDDGVEQWKEHLANLGADPINIAHVQRTKIAECVSVTGPVPPAIAAASRAL